jgi:hypothetical protein
MADVVRAVGLAAIVAGASALVFWGYHRAAGLQLPEGWGVSMLPVFSAAFFSEILAKR